jgi:hypothetical protein
MPDACVQAPEPLNGWEHEGEDGAAGTPGDAPWWLLSLRAAVLLSNAGGVDCGLEYLLRCLFFGITLVSEVCFGIGPVFSRKHAATAREESTGSGAWKYASEEVENGSCLH